MDGKSKLNLRNWDFTDNRHSESMFKPGLGVSFPESNASLYQPGFLKIGAYSDRTTVMDEHRSEASSVSFAWVPQRSFLHPTKTINHLQTMPVISEMFNMSSMPIQSNSSVPESPIAANPINARKQPSSKNKAKNVATKVLRPKAEKGTKKKGGSMSTGKREKKNQDDMFNGVMIDLSGVPAPICSCTGMPRQCYRWGAGGWQSSCCTTGLSEYPLPVSPTRPGSRMAGRKMSIGAYTKLLQRLVAEGQDLSYGVDLKNHWARHGTNKFVTIK
ncbi:hypothetical protein KFK09_018566 [Dendrobium nobile]|uniref:GAGA-binding transcriptional activator n=1 Tax=Dendrobium nobile TaxID=94219 RepID=A0A8T3AWA5_DENNO|nr:hypothetical protein KFK09_018566 [Dendrobium nobile]